MNGNESPCGDKGCTPVQLIRQETDHQKELLKTQTTTVLATLKQLEATANRLDKTLIGYEVRLQSGSEKFDDLEDRIRALEKSRPPTGTRNAIVSTGMAGTVVGIIEAIKAFMR